MKKGRGGGKEHKAPTHFIEKSKLSHAGRVAKNINGCSQRQLHASPVVYAGVQHFIGHHMHTHRQQSLSASVLPWSGQVKFI